MKTFFFKTVLPVLALVLAITSSLAFTSTNNEVNTVPGYIQRLDQHGELKGCDESIQCSNTPSEIICTVGIIDPIQVFGKYSPPSPTNCTKLLFRCPQQ
ncbi:DUF6520 family protein [Flavivirga amylovorans]|uniref:DUF6520 family protein n=1 Tax=Flavivirga amylovorans TaxID=870486 RepID=A0ABT8X6N0_9FLAO|nr:DUF6520 family protein [Flavivirga amylovorans]MDO5989540.1 DUF6520 family protein [Flavivirga amylovorans]